MMRGKGVFFPVAFNWDYYIISIYAYYLCFSLFTADPQSTALIGPVLTRTLYKHFAIPFL